MSLKGDLLRRGLMVNYAEIMTRVPSGRKQAAPVAMTVAATITPAAILNGLITATHSEGGTEAYTLPTGTVMDAALTSDIIINDSFDFTIINLSVADGDSITLTAAAGFTIVGSAVVNSNEFEVSYYLGTGTFRCRKTAANTFVAYRIA